jgi:hypothetical protein
MIRGAVDNSMIDEHIRLAFLDAAEDVRLMARAYQTPIVVWDHERQAIRYIPWNEIPEIERSAGEAKPQESP